ncbi:SRPBCC family protein [Corallococcus sp. M34]|uniref:SRPBCC family protein n=1 Tax=Citreicoccus inhibens TaxID=2849499 RepID=UPI001C230190|nr:SRPBCC family protein [Citreicoccus inhibens]MBU8898543.1 SRPBCC family protein [Citreicoccus inhibens]
MRAGWWGLGGLGLGLGLMYWTDPRNGRWRRAHLQGRAVHAGHEASDAVGIVSRDLSHRTRGLLREALARLRTGEPVPDATLEQRLRAALGRVCSHPGAVRVTALNGHVVLEGDVLAPESRRLVARLRAVRGVKDVDDKLLVHDEPGRHPALQGGAMRAGARLRIHWSPSARFLCAMGGLGLLSWGARRGGALGVAAGLGGALLGVRAVTNQDLRMLTGIDARGRGIVLHKDVTVDAPVEEVFAFWEAMHNFPRFMTHVDDVRLIAKDRSRWRVKGPAGTHFEWEAVTVRSVPNRLLAWRSERNATVRNEGVVRFESMASGKTRVDIRLSYLPPAGALGHAFAKLLGADPKKQMDDDLLRFKSLLERGKATGRETVTREQLLGGRRPSRTTH